jgi:hypothetical protein
MRRILIRAVRAAHFLSDRTAIRFLYRLILGRWPNLDKPVLFTEKLQWLKLNDWDWVVENWVDKLAVREWVANRVDPDLLIPLLKVLDHPFELFTEIHKVPIQPMMIKCTHGSHCGVYVKDQLSVDEVALEKRFRRWMRRNWFWHGREEPYRCLTPKILCEQWIGDADGTPPDDYKIMCFGGRAKVIQVHRKRPDGHHVDFYNRAGVKLTIALKGFKNDGPTRIPAQRLARMIPIAERLAQGTKYLRVDLYNACGRVYFGEITMYDSSGFADYTNGGDVILGGLLDI